MTTVSGTGSCPYTSRKTSEPTTGGKSGGTSGSTGGGSTPGGSKPDDFGHGDYNHDGVVSDAEARVYAADKHSEDVHYQTDSRERIAHEREQGKNYRAELTARTAQIQTASDTKAHRWFGINTSGSAGPMIGPQRPN